MYMVAPVFPILHIFSLFLFEFVINGTSRHENLKPIVDIVKYVHTCTFVFIKIEISLIYTYKDLDLLYKSLILILVPFY